MQLSNDGKQVNIVDNNLTELLRLQQNADLNMQPPEPKPINSGGNINNHLHITEFYNLRKIKYTIEFDGPLKNKMLKRTQFVYTLDLKEDEVVEKLIKERQEAGQKKIY